MNEDRPTNADSTQAGGTEWTEKQLPPVKPPTTGLLMQLFFVPMIIVSIIVSVWLMFGWLAQSSTNPKQLVDNLKKLNKGSWQDAHSLSNLLRDPRETELRQDPELADTLAETLDGLLEDKGLSVSPERHRLATWLCRALGQFEVDNGLPTLLKAVDSEDFQIRQAAVAGISTLAGGMQGDIKTNHDDLVSKLRDLALSRPDTNTREEEMEYGEMRSSLAFALGVIGGDDANDALSLMLSDPYPEARYNAATGLARNGDLRAVPRLREMLKVDNEEAIRYEEQSSTLRQWKQNLVIVNGLRGVQGLYKSNPEAPIDEQISDAVTELDRTKTLHSQDASKFELDSVIRLIADRSQASAQK